MAINNQVAYPPTNPTIFSTFQGPVVIQDPDSLPTKRSIGNAFYDLNYNTFLE